MACCGGGSRPQKVRTQVITKTETVQPQVVQRKIGASPASIQRQHVVPNEQCPKCGYPAMVVYIANRERMQCSNANCRTIIS